MHHATAVAFPIFRGRAWAGVVTLASTLLLAGCFGVPPGADDDTDGLTEVTEDDALGTMTLEVAAFGAPDALDGALLAFTLDHLAFLDDETGTWTAVLVEPLSGEIELSAALGPTASFGILPVPAGTYTDLELVASTATITTDEGTYTASVAESACYAGVPFSLAENEEAELTLWLGGEESLSGSGDSWTFQPAVIGGHTGDDEEDAAFNDPYCE